MIFGFHFPITRRLCRHHVPWSSDFVCWPNRVLTILMVSAIIVKKKHIAYDSTWLTKKQKHCIYCNRFIIIYVYKYHIHLNELQSLTRRGIRSFNEISRDYTEYTAIYLHYYSLVNVHVGHWIKKYKPIERYLSISKILSIHSIIFENNVRSTNDGLETKSKTLFDLRPFIYPVTDA